VGHKIEAIDKAANEGGTAVQGREWRAVFFAADKTNPGQAGSEGSREKGAENGGEVRWRSS